MPLYIYDIQSKVSYADLHIRPWIFYLVKVNVDEEIFFFFFLVDNLVDTMEMGEFVVEVRRWRELISYNFAVCSTGTSQNFNEEQDTWANKYSMLSHGPWDELWLPLGDCYLFLKDTIKF